MTGDEFLAAKRGVARLLAALGVSDTLVVLETIALECAQAHDAADEDRAKGDLIALAAGFRSIRHQVKGSNALR